MLDLHKKIYNFLTTSPKEHITAYSTIYKIMNDDPLIEQNELKKIVQGAIDQAMKNPLLSDNLKEIFPKIITKVIIKNFINLYFYYMMIGVFCILIKSLGFKICKGFSLWECKPECLSSVSIGVHLMPRTHERYSTLIFQILKIYM